MYPDKDFIDLLKDFRQQRLAPMQVNDLGFIASILFVAVPAAFLLILYIQTASRNSKG